jgi:hypothetical protein
MRAISQKWIILIFISASVLVLITILLALNLYPWAGLFFHNIPPGAATIPANQPTPTVQNTLTSDEAWIALLERIPVAWTTPLPPTERTILDGTYVKIDPDEPEWWICRRCPDYLPAGGLWKINFDKGVYRIFYPTINWRSIGSYTIEGDRIYLFNDPYCQYVTGAYTWKLEDGKLTFSVVQDECSFNLRKANLTKQTWLSCQPPNDEAGATGHWMVPEGCEPR